MDSATTPDELLVDVEGGVATVTLHRPEKLNALTHDLVRQLRQTVDELAPRQDVRAVVLTGSGRGFCAGADLSGGPSDAESVVRDLYNPLIETIVNAEVPVLAAINGPAAGAGVSLALACDLRLASASARFELSFVKVGLVPDAGATWLLPRIIGAGRAAEMALLGRRVSAEEASAWGLVAAVVPDEDLAEEAARVAGTLAGLPRSTGATKRLLRSGFERDLTSHLEAEAQAQGLAQRDPDHLEARAAFRERRKPVFSGRSA